jgi:mono/diheme cytochrome c family protein
MKSLLLLFVLSVFASTALAGTSGKSDYKAYCAGCHGANGNVQTEKARALKMDVEKLSLTSSTKSKVQMITIIETGKGDMPDFKKQLTRERISAIADYVLAFKKN